MSAQHTRGHWKVDAEGGIFTVKAPHVGPCPCGGPGSTQTCRERGHDPMDCGEFVAFLPVDFEHAADLARDGTEFIAPSPADMLLMEAAQDLLAVARRAEAWIAEVMVDEFGWPAERVANPPEGSHLHAIRAVIAKATGSTA